MTRLLMLTWYISLKYPSNSMVSISGKYTMPTSVINSFCHLKVQQMIIFLFIWIALCIYFRLWCDILVILIILPPKSLRTKKITTFLMIYLRKWRNPKGRKKHLRSDHDIWDQKSKLRFRVKSFKILLSQPIPHLP